MKSVFTKYEDNQYIEGMADRNTIVYDKEKVVQRRQDKLVRVSEEDIKSMNESYQTHQAKEDFSSRIAKRRKLLSPEQMKMERNMELFRTKVPNFMEFDSKAFGEMSGRIRNDINFKILDARYELGRAMEAQAKKEMLQYNPLIEADVIGESIMKRAVEVLEMREKKRLKTGENWSIPHEYKKYAMKYGVKNGLHLKTFRKASEKLGSFFISSVKKEVLKTFPSKSSRLDVSSKLLPSTSRKGDDFSQVKSMTETQGIPFVHSRSQPIIKPYMMSGDVYFKDYIEKGPQNTFTPKMMELQAKIEKYGILEKKKDSRILLKACSIGRSFKKLKEYTHSEIGEIEPKNVQFRNFKKLLRKEEINLEKLISRPIRKRKSISTKVLKAIT